MGRKRVNAEQAPARFPAGTLEQIGALLVDKERQADFIRKAVAREIKRRERISLSKAPQRRT